MNLETYTASLTPSLPILPFIISGLGIAMFAGALFLFRGKNALVGSIVAIAIFVGGVGFTIGEDVNSSHTKMENLQVWIQDKYSVSVTTHQTKELCIGKEVTISYNNEKIPVRLKEYKSNGKLLVENNVPLPQK
jgi:hypothetical protein